MFWKMIQKWFIANIIKHNEKTKKDNICLDEKESSMHISEKNNLKIELKTIWERINNIKVSIKSFENIFKEKSQEYMIKILAIENKYIAQKKEFDLSCQNPNILSVAIDPEDDLNFASEVSKFEQELDNFITTDVKPQIINLRLDKYIVAISKLYSAIRKDVGSRHVQDRINEAIIKFQQITSDTLNDSEKVAIISNNTVLQDKFYNAKYLIAKIIILTNGVNELENVFSEDEKVYYLIQLHKELDILEEKLIKFTDLKYDKLKLDFQRISNLNYLMPSEKVFENRKFWLDFFDIEKTIYEEERKMEKALKVKKIKNNQLDNTNIITALNKIKLLNENKVEENNCRKFITWSKKLSYDSDEFKLVIDIIKYIDEDISWNDIYNILTLFEVRHLIKDEIISSTDIIIQELRNIYINKYTDSYEKLIKNKESILQCVDLYNEFLLILKTDKFNKIMPILQKLKISAYNDSEKIYINSVYFVSSNYFVDILKTKEMKSA